MSRMKEIREAVCRAVREQGGQIIEVEQTKRNHQRCVWELGGRKLRYNFPLTPSDWRSTLNACSDVRRLCREAKGAGA